MEALSEVPPTDWEFLAVCLDGLFCTLLGSKDYSLAEMRAVCKKMWNLMQLRGKESPWRAMRVRSRKVCKKFTEEVLKPELKARWFVATGKAMSRTLLHGQNKGKLKRKREQEIDEPSQGRTRVTEPASQFSGMPSRRYSEAPADSDDADTSDTRPRKRCATPSRTGGGDGPKDEGTQVEGEVSKRRARPTSSTAKRTKKVAAVMAEEVEQPREEENCAEGQGGGERRAAEAGEGRDDLEGGEDVRKQEKKKRKKKAKDAEVAEPSVAVQEVLKTPEGEGAVQAGGGRSGGCTSSRRPHREGTRGGEESGLGGKSLRDSRWSQGKGLSRVKMAKYQDGRYYITMNGLSLGSCKFARDAELSKEAANYKLFPEERASEQWRELRSCHLPVLDELGMEDFMCLLKKAPREERGGGPTRGVQGTWRAWVSQKLRLHDEEVDEITGLGFPTPLPFNFGSHPDRAPPTPRALGFSGVGKVGNRTSPVGKASGATAEQGVSGEQDSEGTAVRGLVSAGELSWGGLGGEQAARGGKLPAAGAGLLAPAKWSEAELDRLLSCSAQREDTGHLLLRKTSSPTNPADVRVKQEADFLPMN